MARIRTKDKERPVKNKSSKVSDGSSADVFIFICLCLAAGIVGYIAVVVIPAFIAKGALG